MPKTNSNLKKLLQGGITFMAGSMGAMLLQFVTGIVVIRLVTPAEYGRISLAYIVVNVLVMIAAIGFSHSVPRFIANFREKKDHSAVGATAGSALLVTLCLSLIFVLLLYAGMHHLALFLDKPMLPDVLSLFLWMIPPFALMLVLSAIFRGLENAWPQAMFVDWLQNFSRLLLLLLVALIGLGYQAVLLAYLISVWIAFVAYLVYALRTLWPQIRPHFHWGTTGELLRFSLPLLGVGIMADIMNWAGTLELGYYGSDVDVALFNAPQRLTNVIPVPLAAVIFLYLPLATRLIAGSAHDELEELYVSATKWAFLLSLPLTLYFMIDAEYVVVRLFGGEYRNAAILLQILALGSSVNTFTGPNGMTLVAHGDTRVVFKGTVIAALSTIVLCAVLIPHYGAVGAALGTAAAQLLANIFMSLILYLRYRIHPFTAHYLKPVLFAVVASLIACQLLDLGKSSSDVEHLLLFLLIMLIALLAPVITRSLTRGDIELLAVLERRLNGKMVISTWLGAKMRKSD